MSTTGTFFGAPLSSLAADTPVASLAADMLPRHTPSLIKLILIVLAAGVIVLLISLTCHLYKRFQRSFRTFSDDDHNNSRINRHVAPTHLLDPFRPISVNRTDEYCAVCCSKFEAHDNLSSLPLCFHAFHSQCIHAWIATNPTCPLCRSNVFPSVSDVLDKIVEIVVPNTVESTNSIIGGSFDHVMDGNDDRSIMENVDRVASSRTLSFFGSGRSFGGSSRRSDDLEANRAWDEISSRV